jgi:flavorubredoxin
MKVLVVYDTVSPQKLTMKIAETISDVLKTRGIEVDSFFVKNVDLATVKNCDCLVAGSPTMYFRASSGIMQFLNSFQDKEFSGKLAAAFDTQWQGRFYGNATKGIESKLRRLGFEIISPPLIAYVEGKTNQWQLKEGELEKTKKYAEDLANKLHP